MGYDLTHSGTLDATTGDSQFIGVDAEFTNRYIPWASPKTIPSIKAQRKPLITACGAFACAMTFPESAASNRPLQVIVPLSKLRDSIVEFEFEARSRQLV